MVFAFFNKMSVNNSVLFSSSRVNFGEPPNTAAQAASSLLTFADMVLALDHKIVSDSSCLFLTKRDSDHTYASNGCTRTTRSQSAKAAAQLDRRHNYQGESLDEKNAEIKEENISIYSKISPNKIIDYKNLTAKRCSSVETLHFNSSNIKPEMDLTLTGKVKSEFYPVNSGVGSCEWSSAFVKNSPKKSSSFEEVCFDNNKSSIKTSKSTESVQKSCASFRLVNDTLEFPCWPRKADHTYATATWDGTAASHSLFEQENCKDCEDHHMEISNDHDYSSQRHNDLNENLSIGQSQVLQSFFPPLVTQKEDHTYVKPKTAVPISPEKKEVVPSIDETMERQPFSSATFPRQKTRDDHTYFHSGLNKKSSGSIGAKDWFSAHSVEEPVVSQEKYIEEAYRSLQSSTQISYAKKDHNYSSST